MASENSIDILARSLSLAKERLAILEKEYEEAKRACEDRFIPALKREELILEELQPFMRHHPWGITKGRIIRNAKARNRDFHEAKRKALADIAHRLTLLEKDSLAEINAREEAVKSAERAFESQETDIQRRLFFKIESCEKSTLEPASEDALRLLKENDHTLIRAIREEITKKRHQGYDEELALRKHARESCYARAKAHAEKIALLKKEALDAQTVYERKHYNNEFGRSIILLELETQSELVRFQLEKAWFALREEIARERIAIAERVDANLAQDENRLLTAYHRASFTLAKACSEIYTSLKEQLFQVLEDVLAKRVTDLTMLSPFKTSFGFTVAPFIASLKALVSAKDGSSVEDVRTRFNRIYLDMALPLREFREAYMRAVLLGKAENERASFARESVRRDKTREWDELGPLAARECTNKAKACREEAKKMLDELKKEHKVRLEQFAYAAEVKKKAIEAECEERVKREQRKYKSDLKKDRKYIARKKKLC